MARTLAMFTDTSLCIGCRACQVACKEWNELPSEQPEWTGTYQNHSTFTDKTYRLVRFIEKPQANGELSWLLMSDGARDGQYQSGCLQRLPLLRQLLPLRRGLLQSRYGAGQQVHVLQ
jgi:formate dehydrogenase iron-sulfur subunit